MKALIYISQSQINFSSSALLELELKSIKNNKKMDITGLLSYSNNSFYQYLEGEENLDLLMEKIRNDQRHVIKKTLHFYSLTERIFPKWYMKIYKIKQGVLTEDLLIRNLFSFVGNQKANNKFIKASFIQNLISISQRIY